MKTFTFYSPALGNSRGALLLIHGAGEHIGRYRWAVEQWNRANYDVLGGDLPGYGQNEGKRGHVDRFEDYIDTVNHWYDMLRSASPHLPFVFGHSLGGLIAARFMETKQRAAAGVILTSPCFGVKVKVPAWKEMIAKTLNILYPSLVLSSGISPHKVTRNQEIVLQTSQDPLNAKGASVRWYRELMKHIELNWLERESFPDIPFLIQQAGDDNITDKAEAHHWFETVSLQDKTFREWPGLYHEVLNEPERQLVMNDILEWMSLRQA